jgi:peptidoglycan/xylan/chitin deacetylase (PgdA/CDA1 family)
MKKVLLSFDIEEFDMPMEYGKIISMDRQIQTSEQGTTIILDLLLKHRVKATFFSTVIFASHVPHIIKRIIREGHELASHGYYHSSFQNEHLEQSRKALEQLSGQPVKGYRMARMMPVEAAAIMQAGYSYNSSLNPTYLPGRYNNFFKPRTLFKSGDLIELPASVTPLIRFPLFWLSFHNSPIWLYKAACKQTINNDQYLNLYFHPWEFTDLHDSALGMPGFVSRNSGNEMIKRFDNLLAWMQRMKYNFERIGDFLLVAKV